MLATDYDKAFQWFEDNPNNNPRLRPYQRLANDSVEKAIAAGKRQMLVAMATGTGKTFTTVNQAYRLLKSGAARRVLFLVDRRALTIHRRSQILQRANGLITLGVAGRMLAFMHRLVWPNWESRKAFNGLSGTRGKMTSDSTALSNVINMLLSIQIVSAQTADLGCFEQYLNEHLLGQRFEQPYKYRSRK